MNNFIPKKIKVGKKEIGFGRPSFIVAEIGSNHNQDFSLAFGSVAPST